MKIKLRVGKAARRTALACAIGATMAAGLAAVQPASASGQFVRSESTSAAPDGVLLQYGTASLRVGVVDPPSMPAEFGDIAAAAAGLADWNDGLFADSYYDPETRQVVISPATKEAAVVAQEFVKVHGDRVRIAAVQYSHQELKAAGHEFILKNDFLDREAHELSVSRGSRGVDIVLSQMPDDPQALLEEAAEYPFEVNFIVTTDVPVEGSQPFDADRRNDTSPFSGGLGFIMADGAAYEGLCSGAFGYRIGTTDHMLTAGHCYWNNQTRDRMYMLTPGSTWSNPALGAWVGNWNGQSSFNEAQGSITVNGGFHGDIALVNLTQRSNEASKRIWDGGPVGTSKRDVYNRTAPYLDLFICKGGATSGSSCGTLKVTAVNTDMELAPGFWLMNGDRARATNQSECSQSGDSGGSIYSSRNSTTVTAVGVISGHTDFAGGDCQQRFTGVEEAVQAWGGDAKQTG